jgi:hypothetical protein
MDEPPPQERSEGKKRGDRDDLSAKNDAIEIERRPPGSVTVLDDEDASGSRAEAKADTALVGSLFSCASAAADDGDRQNRGAVGLNGIAENPAGGDRVLCVDENMLCIHERLQARRMQERVLEWAVPDLRCVPDIVPTPA